MTANEQAAKVSFVIDGMELTVPAGTTILEAARMFGIYIPTLCFLDKLKPIGACRVCSVEAEGVESPIMSCTTPAIEGMKITTQSDDLQQYRKQMIQFILVNHPLDCPVCERSGECRLQNLTYEFGITGHGWATAPRAKVPVVDWGLIRYDKNLCILCERCVKICREVQGVAAYKIDGNGFDSRINTVTGEKLDCDFCGQCISVCPVGALSSGMYFSGRSWEMERVQTVCPHCAVGCSFRINVKKGARFKKQARIVRVTSDPAIGHNNGNLCARGRFGYEFIQSGERLLSPLVKLGYGHVIKEWDEAYRLLSEQLTSFVSAHGGDAVYGIGSERDTNEDNYVFQKFFRDVLGSNNVNSVVNMINPDTASGLFDKFGDVPMTTSYREMRKGSLFVFIGAEGSNENPVTSNHIRQAVINRGAEVAVAYSKEVDFLPAPKLQVPYEYTGMHQFTLELLLAAVRSLNSDGEFPDGTKLSGEWSDKLEKAAAGAPGTFNEETRQKTDELVKLIRTQERPVYIIGMEAQRHAQGTAIVQNIVNLAKITGGKLMLSREYCNSQGAIDMGLAPNTLPGYGEVDGSASKDGKKLLELMEADKIKALVIVDEDVLNRYPDSERLKKAIRNVDFVAVMDQFYTKTCLVADVVVPTTTAASKSGTFTNLEGRIQKLNPAVEPPGESRHVWEIFTELSKRMGKPFSFETSGDITREIARDVEIYSDGGGLAEFADYGKLRSSRPDVKWAEPASMKSFDSDKTFILLPDNQLFGMGLYTDYCPALRPLMGKPYADFHLLGKPNVTFHPEDADKLGISDGDSVGFKHDDGQWDGTVRISQKVARGTIRIPDENDLYPSVKLVYKGGESDCVSGEGLKG
ncbi:MAG: molybdopterin-dependent oxidoreductase [Nitrospinota bacterium]